MSMRSLDFMRALPDALRARLPRSLHGFKTFTRPWLAQFSYDGDARIHYEVWNLGKKRGQIEIGLHFETRDRAYNQRLLRHFDRHMIEVKAELGNRWEAEQWDRGWTKVGAVIERGDTLDQASLDEAAEQLANAIQVLQPILESFADD